MQFKIDLKIFILIILFYFTKQMGIYALVLGFAIIHEFGHLLAGLILGMKPSKLLLKPYGVSIIFKLLPNDYNKKIGKGNVLELKKILVALAGPLTNLIIIVALMNFNLNLFFGLMIIYANILLIIFNLIPIYPLDGGRILKGILYILFGKKKAEKYTNYISFIFLIFITFFGSISIISLKNIAIFIIIIFLWVIYIKEERRYKRKKRIYKLVEKTLENSDD